MASSASPRRRHLSSVAVALTVAALAAAGSVATADAAPQAGTEPCVRSLPTGTSTVAVPFGGTTYSVQVHVPDASPNKPLPLVLDLHGSNSNGVAQSTISDLDQVADAEQFLVANPSAAIALATTTPLPEGNWAWNVPGVPTTAGAFPPADARNDVAFLAAVIDHLDATGCVDGRRVYATGYSGGGRMASALACARPDLIAAIAPVAGLRAGRPDPAQVSQPDAASCQPDTSVAVVSFHGTADFVNPYNGSPDLRWGYPVELAADRWAGLNDCRQGPVTRQVAEHVSTLTWTSCDRRADVVLYSVAGGGHTWPDTDVDLSFLGSTTREINASRVMWDFFEQHPRIGRA